MQDTRTRPKREPILVVLHADNTVEVYGEKNQAVKIIRCPQSFSDEMAILAEDFVEESLPPFWRQVFLPGRLLASAVNRPLLPSTVREAKLVEALIHGLNNASGKSVDVEAA